jgi:hypothetical protein
MPVRFDGQQQGLAAKRILSDNRRRSDRLTCGVFRAPLSKS